jgi:poly(A) polymerase
MKFKDVETMRASTLKRFVRQPHFDEHLALHRLDCLSSNRQLQSYEFVQHFLANTPPEQVRPERLLTGDDLQAMGFQPGPLYSQILGSLEDAQLEGQISTKEDARKYILKRFGQEMSKQV